VQKAVQDKRSTIIRAEGEARSAALIGEAMSRNPSWLELKRIEAAKDIAATVAASANRVYLSADSLMLDLVKSVGFDELRPKPPLSYVATSCCALSDAG
jgi:prohibitin 2